MAYSESLAERARKALARRKGITEKKMFGGVGFLLRGNMCVGIWKGSLIARVGPERYEESLAQEYVREFDITGKSMKGWVLVEPEGVETDEQLAEWVRRSLEFVVTLPAK
jgi:TfoX/Sxy family transcriptional regulator of competence genes